jgi:hypothetical protein
VFISDQELQKLGGGNIVGKREVPNTPVQKASVNLCQNGEGGYWEKIKVVRKWAKMIESLYSPLPYHRGMGCNSRYGCCW